MIVMFITEHHIHVHVHTFSLMTRKVVESPPLERPSCPLGATAINTSFFGISALRSVNMKWREVLLTVLYGTAGFCGETEEEHQDTLSLMQQTQYDQAFMFAYSEREKTHAARHLPDDVPAEVKSRRLQEIIATFRDGQRRQMEAEIGCIHLVRMNPCNYSAWACLVSVKGPFTTADFVCSHLLHLSCAASIGHPVLSGQPVCAPAQHISGFCAFIR